MEIDEKYMYMKKIFYIFFIVVTIFGCSPKKNLEPYFCYYDEKTQLSGFIDKYGDVVIRPQWDYVSNFNEGYAIVGKNPDSSFSDISEKNEPVLLDCVKWGVIDYMGNVIVKPQYDAIDDFHEGLAGFELRGKHGYLNTSGDVAIEPIFERCGKFHEGLASVRISNKYGFINRNGEMVLKPQYDYVYDFYNDIAIVSCNERVVTLPKGQFDFDINVVSKYALIDRAGKFVTDTIFSSCDPFSEGLALAEVDGKYGYINVSGNFVIEPNFTWGNDKARYPADFSEGKAVVRYGDQYGYIDKKGKIIIIPSFAYAYPFKEGFAKVITKDDNTCYINEEGRIIVNGDSLLYVYGFFDKLMVAKLKDGQFVHINNNGKIAWQK